MLPTWLVNIVSHWGFRVVAVIASIILIGGGIYLYHRNGYNLGYQAGYVQSLKDNPPNVYTGTTTVNQQPCHAPTVFGIDIGKWGFGLIHKT